MRLHGLDGIRLVEPDQPVKLPRQNGRRVVRLSLGIRSVDDTDEPLQPLLHQRLSKFLTTPPLPQVEHKVRDTRGMHELLVAVGQARIHPHDAHIRVPAVGGRHGARVGEAADAQGLLRAKRLLAQLADVVLVARPAHARGPRVANVAVVSPHDGLGARAAVLEDAGQGLEHVRVAQVPRLVAGVVHGLVVVLCVCCPELVMYVHVYRV